MINAPVPDTFPPNAIASVVNVNAFALAAIVDPVVIPEALKVNAVFTVTASVYVCVPEVVIVEVLIAVVPDTDKFLPVPLKVTVSAVPSPNTALPVIANPYAPVTVPLKVVVVALKVASAPKVTLFLYSCVPLVVIEPPLIAVVPVVEFWRMLVALTVELKVDVPVLVSEILPNPREPPTAPVKVMFPEPTDTVNDLAEVASLFKVELNKTLLLVVVNETSPPKVTAPEYVCVPVVVMFAEIVETPETLRVVNPDALPPNAPAPVRAKALAPPVIVEVNVMVVPDNVLVAPVPLRVTGPVYV